MRLALGFAAVALLAACSATAPFRPSTSETATVVWIERGERRAAVVGLEVAPGEVRLRDSAASPRFVVRRVGGAYLERGRVPFAGAASVIEAWETARLLPPGENEVRTARYSVRVWKPAGRLARFEVVDVATGARLRVEFAPTN